ncbi:MAG: TRAP transporter small permease [Saprospiraceae bacterium]|nr:TRAP transporter small permease [Saprospiraceae bacterium]
MRSAMDSILKNILAVLMAVMVVDVLWGVFTRYVLGAQSPWTEELARFLLIWIGILGAAFASGKRMHLAIDILPTALEGSRKRLLENGINLIILLFAVAVLLIGGSRLVFVTSKLGQVSTSLDLPLAVVYAIVPISGLFIVIYKLMDLLQPSVD